MPAQGSVVASSPPLSAEDAREPRFALCVWAAYPLPLAKPALFFYTVRMADAKIECRAVVAQALNEYMRSRQDARAVDEAAAEDEGLPIPKPTQQSKIFCGNNEEMSLINADTLKYRKTTLQLSANA